jgi:hypothetical protein
LKANAEELAVVEFRAKEPETSLEKALEAFSVAIDKNSYS